MRVSDFDDFEELRKYKPWVAAFVVREDLRGSGVGTLVLELIEQKAKSFGIDQIYLWTEGESGTEKEPRLYPGTYVEYVEAMGQEAPGTHT